MTTPISIAVYLPATEPFCSETGGALALWVREVYSRLPENFSCRVYAPAAGQDDRGIPVLRVKDPAWKKKLLGPLRNREFRGALRGIKHYLRSGYARNAARMIRDQQPDILHIMNDPEAVLPIRRRNPGARIILHLQNDHLIEGHISRDGIAVQAVELADEVWFCSRYLMEGALRNVPNLTAEKSAVIYNGATIPETSETDALIKETTPSSNPVLLFLGRIVPEKGLHILMDAMEIILKVIPDMTLKVAGGITFGSTERNEYLQGIMDRSSAMSGHVEFLGPVPHQDVQALMEEATLFLCPSIWNEPLGIVNLEAMAAGTPVVAFANGGIPETVGGAGVLVESCTAEALGEAVVSLYQDPSRLALLSSLGRKRVEENFTWAGLAEQWSEVLTGS